MTIQMTLLVEPKSQQHGARASIRGGKIHHYNDAGKVAYMNQVILESKHHAPPKPLEGPLMVRYQFFLPKPKSNKDGTPHRSGGDIGNYCKHTEDALTKAGFWLNDRQVISMTLHKLFAETGTPPRIEIEIATMTVM